MYDILSLVYDPWQKSYGKDYSAIILPRLLATMDLLTLPPSAMLDIACGTGSLAVMLARRGWTVWGIDASRGMLARARQKAAATSLPLRFVLADMRDFNLHREFPLITCLFDSVNHLLTKRALLQTFRAVARHLEPGGYFVFDVNNERCFLKIWRQPYITDKRDFTLILKNHYTPSRKRARAEVILFQKNAVKPRTEVIHERCYAPKEIRELLKRAELNVVVCEDFNFTDVPDVGRVKTWWVAQKPSAAAIGRGPIPGKIAPTMSATSGPQ